MAETIEERLRREDDAKELTSYNELVNKINELIPKIVEQFSIKLPCHHVWVDDIIGSEPKAAWELYSEYYGAGVAWITTEGYILVMISGNDNKDESIAMIRRFELISHAREKTQSSDSQLKVSFTSTGLSYFFTALESFYKEMF